MSTQRRDESNPFDPDRDSSTGRATRARSVAQSIVTAILPLPATPRADDADRGESWFSIATLLAAIALATCAAAAVAALYGPVFTQPMMGP